MLWVLKLAGSYFICHFLFDLIERDILCHACGEIQMQIDFALSFA